MILAAKSFWRGEAPLKAALWYWGVSAWIVLALIHASWPVPGLVAMALLVVHAVYVVFSAVGIVRSAKRYSGNTAFKALGYVVPIGYVLFWFLFPAWAIVLLLMG